MCESTVYILRNGIEEMFFEDVDALEVQDHLIRLINIFGETKEIAASIRRFSLVDHKILLEPR